MALLSGSDSFQSILDQMGSEYGFRTTSTYRTPSYNSTLPGSVPNSQHTIGTARDYSVRGKTKSQIDTFLDALNAVPGLEAFVHGEDYGQPHIHTEIESGKADSSCPSWIPESLCSGFKTVMKYSPTGLGYAAGQAAASEAKDTFNNWVNWQARVALLGIALILIATAIVFVFKDSAAEIVGGTVVKALKGA